MKFRNRDAELDMDDAPDPAGSTDEDSDEKPKPKLVKKPAKAKVEVEEEEDEKPAKKSVAKKKAAKAEEEEEAPKPKAKTAKKPAKSTKEREPRETNFDKYGTPYVPDTMVGGAFALCQKGTTLDKLKAFIEKNKEGKKGGYWVISDFRKGEWRGVSWKWHEDKETGAIKITNVRASVRAAA